MDEKYVLRRHWFRLFLRLLNLSLFQHQKTEDLVKDSYNRISSNYDTTWTTHMRVFTEEMIKKLPIPDQALCLDLMCGTGFVTGKVAEHNICQVIGVDISEGMLQIARAGCPEKSTFIHKDALSYLKNQPSHMFDVITCAWGLGYSTPSKLIHEISRVLKPGGCVGIIDNSIFSISEMYLSALPVLAEKPEAITHMMKIHFLPGIRALKLRMFLAGIPAIESWAGKKTYYASTGQEAVHRMKSTGASAGFEFSFYKEAYEEREQRFMNVLEERYGHTIPITHRYIAAIGKKKT
jgi:ubiquinone/menaquinone biosynthesis C-methylase UbiE